MTFWEMIFLTGMVSFSELPRYNQLANNGIPANVWTSGYDAIARANRAIAGITANSGLLTAAKAKAFIAECKFVRAVANFYLVNFLRNLLALRPMLHTRAYQ